MHVIQRPRILSIGRSTIDLYTQGEILEEGGLETVLIPGKGVDFRTGVRPASDGTPTHITNGGKYRAGSANGEAGVSLRDDLRFMLLLTEEGQPFDPHSMKPDSYWSLGGGGSNTARALRSVGADVTVLDRSRPSIPVDAPIPDARRLRREVRDEALYLDVARNGEYLRRPFVIEGLRTMGIPDHQAYLLENMPLAVSLVLTLGNRDGERIILRTKPHDETKQFIDWQQVGKALGNPYDAVLLNSVKHEGMAMRALDQPSSVYRGLMFTDSLAPGVLHALAHQAEVMGSIDDLPFALEEPVPQFTTLDEDVALDEKIAYTLGAINRFRGLSGSTYPITITLGRMGAIIDTGDDKAYHIHLDDPVLKGIVAERVTANPFSVHGAGDSMFAYYSTFRVSNIEPADALHHTTLLMPQHLSRGEINRVTPDHVAVRPLDRHVYR